MHPAARKARKGGAVLRHRPSRMTLVLWPGASSSRASRRACPGCPRPDLCRRHFVETRFGPRGLPQLHFAE